MILTNAEIIEITGKQRYKTQALVLARMGVPCITRPDGRPIVSRVAFERVVGDDSRRKSDAFEPDFSKLDS